MRAVAPWILAVLLLVGASSQLRLSSRAPDPDPGGNKQLDTPIADSGNGPRSEQTGLALLPESLSALRLEPSVRDPFAQATRDAPDQARTLVSRMTPLPLPARVVPAPLVLVPSAPALTLRFLGKLIAPDGVVIVMLAKGSGSGETPVSVSVGMALDENYVVKSVDDEAVRLIHGPTALVVEVPLPPPPAPGAQ